MQSILIIGLVAVIACTTVQCAMIAFLRRSVRIWRENQKVAHTFVQETMHLSMVVAALFLGVLIQVGLWAMVFIMTGDLPDLEAALYYSMASFTTVGYGDVVITGENAILGPMEACNGILMGGLATGFLFSTMQSRFDAYDSPRA